MEVYRDERENYIEYTFVGNLDRRYAVITTVTASAEIVTSWINETLSFRERRRHHGIVSFKVNHMNPSVITVLQFAAGGRCLLFQLCHATADIPQSLRDFLADPSFAFVGFRIPQESIQLCHGRNLHFHNIKDLRFIAGYLMDRWDLRELQNLAFGMMGVLPWNKPAMVKTSDYSSRDLSFDEVRYACIELIVSGDIGRRLWFGNFYKIRDWFRSFVVVG